MKVAIVANGQLDVALLPAIKQAEYIVGVDRAAYWLLEHNITPDIALGDFDSTSSKELVTIKNNVKTFQEPPHPKFKTDLEMAIEHTFSLHPQEVTMYGVIGSRLDQSISAVNLLEQFLEGTISATIRDSRNKAFLTNSSKTITKSGYTYFSVLAYTEEIVVSIHGALYPLDKYTLARTVSLGTSNEIAGTKATVEIHSGTALIIQSRD